MLEEEAAELAFAEAEAFGELFYGGVVAVERAFVDECEGSGDGVRGAAPGGGVGRGFRAAAEAGAEAGFLRSGCGGEEAAVFELHAASWADGPTVDSGGSNADVDEAVEARVFALQSAVADLRAG